MFEYELHRMRAAELQERSDRRRLAEEARGARRAERRSRDDDPGRGARGPARSRFTRAA